MHDIPQGFIDRAISEVRNTFFFDRNNGIYHPAEHYFIIGAESIWNSYIRWKNHDSSKNDRSFLTIRDIEYGCGKYGNPCDHVGIGDLLVRMENMTYIFIPLCGSCYGGPAGSEMKYLMNIFSSEEIKFSIGALFRFLKWFDKAIPRVREQIEAELDNLGRQFKRALILQAGAEQILEPGLEDVDYRYSFRSDDEDYLDIWIYYGKGIRLTFRYDEYFRDPQFIKNIVKSLAENYGNISGYTKWATDLSNKDEAYPEYGGRKNAGVCVWHERNF